MNTKIKASDAISRATFLKKKRHNNFLSNLNKQEQAKVSKWQRATSLTAATERKKNKTPLITNKKLDVDTGNTIISKSLDVDTGNTIIS